MTVRLGILAHLEAKPGKGEELAAFLAAGRDLAVAELLAGKPDIRTIDIVAVK